MHENSRPSPRPRLGISACLLGERVRFDGNHKLNSYIVGTLGRFFDFVPVCPEVAIGMGIPRPPIHLVGDPEQPRAVGVRDPELDVTDALTTFSQRQVRELGAICGYILKSKSPSCGMERVKVYGEQGLRHSAGLYARALMTAHPLLPVEEEGRLGDPGLRDNFLERVFAFRRWQLLAAAGLTPGELVEFHAMHKLSLMAHGQERYRALGRLVAEAGTRPLAALTADYLSAFMAALKQTATIKRQVNVLHHAMGYLKRELDREDKAELLEVITAYAEERVPLVVPITLLKHHFRRHPHPYMDRQVYLNPPREELFLRRGGV